MPESELITIGAFARLCGLSASALRFYADAGVLVPAVVDEATGYRYYAPDQTGTARLIRRLRALDMPLPAVAAVVTEPDADRATALVDAHLTALDAHLASLRTAADAARASLDRSAFATPESSADASGAVPSPNSQIGTSRSAEAASGTASGRAEPRDTASAEPDAVRVRGPVLAAALDQVATATVVDPRHPVLDSVHIEAGMAELVLTATDRYRLATRGVRVDTAPAAPWAITVDAADLRATVSWLRRQPTVVLRPDAAGLLCTTGDTADTGGDERGQGDRNIPRANRTGPESGRRCRSSAEEFPDYRAMLAALPPVRVRVVVQRSALLAVLESVQAATVTLEAIPGSLRLTDGESVHTLAATVTGPPMTIHFAVTTLYPAVAGAVGPDLMLDLIAPDQPVRVRSADDGTLLTLAMPRRPESADPATH
ncbi:MerR family transcriptional regulator [Nocardia sp. NPDC004415]